VILSRGYAQQALDWTRRVMSRIELTLNEAKTSIRRARQERFDFLGYTFGPYRYRKDGHWYLGTGPSRKSISRVRQKVGEVLKPSNVRPWEEVPDQLNRLLRGWAAYFNQGTRLMAYRPIDHHGYTRVRLFLIRRHKVPSRGTGRYPDTEVFGALGVLRLRSLHCSSLP
jgi:RNA-directed DNA polymerase